MVVENLTHMDDLLDVYPFRSQDHEWIEVTCGHCQHSFKVPIKCRNRFCPTCSRGRQSRVRRRISNLINSVPKLEYRTFKLLTLTIPNSQTCEEGYKNLTKAFRRLRQRLWWKSKVTGGCYVVEVTKGQNGYHVHMHVICQALMLPIDEFRREWIHVSGAHIVDVRAMWNIDAANYLTKYLTKVKGDSRFVLEIGIGLKGKRLYQPFGSWHALDLSIPKIKYACPKCQSDAWITDWDIKGGRLIASGWDQYDDWLATNYGSLPR